MVESMETKEIINNDVKIFYGKQGSGRPLIFLHCWGSKAKMYNNVAKQFAAEGFVVYTPDTRGHGRSGKVKRLRYEDMADDIMELIRAGQMEKPILFGFSDGGIVGLILAAKYPDVLGQLIVAGINLTPKGMTKRVRFMIKFGFFFTRSDKLRLIATQPNITADDLGKITAPTTIFHAQRDIVKLSDSQIAVTNIPNATLIQLPNEDHGSYVVDNVKLYHLLRGILA